MKNSFDPKDWLDSKPNHYQNNDKISSVQKQNSIDKRTETKNQQSYTDKQVAVDAVVDQIEKLQIDLTSKYEDWLNIGFALADEFGESGRSLYHRISQYYVGYDSKECDVQFDSCLKSNGHGISINTFFFLAKQSGILVYTKSNDKYNSKTQRQELPNNTQINGYNLEQQVEQHVEEPMPTIPESVYAELPEFLKKTVKVATSDEERDILLLGSLATISSCLPNLFGIYDGRKVFSNLFLFITAQASAGKGSLVYCRKLVKKIHKEFREETNLQKQNYESEMADYNTNKNKVEGLEKPTKPKEKMLFIPANNSATGAYQLISDCDGKGLIFETEGDTLAHAFKSDYGNYSDGFRKAFHHETISYYRRTDSEFVDIENPCLSTVLSGTQNQILTLIPNAENGLLSRFIFYYMNAKPEWKNVFADKTDNGLDAYFENLGDEFYSLYKLLNSSGDFKFHLTADQQERFNQFFSQTQMQYLNLKGKDYMATVRRLGLIAFRLCMIFSALRMMETGDISNNIICDERDLKASLAIIGVLVKHSSKVFNDLPREKKIIKRLNKKEKFLHSLPKKFNRQKYIEVAEKLKIIPKTAEVYITSFVEDKLVHREQHNNYINVFLEESQDSKDM